MRQGSGTSKTGDHGLKYALQGWFETEVSYNFETQQWDFIILTGGFTAGGGMGYEWTWNMQVGPVPLFFQLEAGASGAVQFNAALWEKGNTRANDYLTELRLYAYLQAFGGVGFDYAIIALKLGLYGRVGLTAQLRWLNTAEPVNIGDAYGTEFAGQYLDVDGEVGAKFQVELLLISYEKILWSQPIQFYEGSFNDWKGIDDYWENTKKGIGNGSFIHPEEEETPSTRALSQPNLLMADSSGMGIYYADREPALLDRDYLEQYERTYDTSGPSLGGGFQLFSLFADGEASPVVKTLGNSYTQAAPSLTDDGGYLFYLDDLNDSGDATKVRAAVMTQNGTGYDSEHPVIFGEDDDSGYGDSGLNASGSGKDVAAVWSRVMAEPAITEPGQTVTSDIQADMMNNSHVFVAVLGDGGWKVTDLTEDFAGGNLSPVVARKGDHILVAWRQVTSTTADVTDFNARDYIYCAVSNNGGKTWTKPTPIYNGTSGAVKGLETAMLPSGAAAVAFTLQGEDHDIAEGIYDQNVAYAIVGSEPADGMADVQRYVVLEEAALAENPQMAAVQLDEDTNAFVLGWYSLDPDTQAGDIRLAAMDERGNRITGFVDALSDLIRNSETAVSADFQFVQNADTLDELSILWSGAAEEMAETTTEDGAAAGAEGVDAFGCVSGLRLRTVEENGMPKVSVTAAGGDGPRHHCGQLHRLCGR